MKHRHIFLCGSLCIVFLLVQFPQAGDAQTEGFIAPLSMTTSSLEEALPPGAVYEGTQVRHVVAPQENLHILAAYYYGNPRKWRQIYQENRNVIRNVNRLPVGKTLVVTVGESWRPLFTYEEWLQLAHRNGLWQPGQWQRAAAAGGQTVAPSVQPTPTPEEQPKVPTDQREQAVPEEIVSPPEEPPAEEAPVVEATPVTEEPPAVEETPAAEPTPQETPPPRETAEEETETEQAPAF